MTTSYPCAVRLDGGIGVGFFHFKPHTGHARLVSKEFPGGMIRRSWLDKDGRVMMTGWFRRES